MAKIPRAAGTAVKVEDEFHAALAALVEEVKQDRSILAAILCGSLSHDTVWSKSDIDLLLVTIDDKKADKEGFCLYANGINVHACLMPRAEFRKTAEGAIRNSFLHSLLAALEFRLGLEQFFLMRFAPAAALARPQAAQSLVAFAQLVGQFRNVPHNGPHERQGGVGLRDREILLPLFWLTIRHVPPLGLRRGRLPTSCLSSCYHFLAAGAGSGGFVQTGSATSFDPATAVGLSVAWPQATSSGSLAKSMMHPSRLYVLWS